MFVFPYSLLGWKPLLFTLLIDGTGFLRWERDWSPSWREGASRVASGMECDVQGADKDSKKGMRDRYVVTPGGDVLKSKKEMQAFLYLDSLEPQPPDHLSP